MIVEVRSDRGVIRVNQDFVNAVPEFEAVMTLGVKYMAYTAYMCDPSSDNIYFNLPEDVRHYKLKSKLELDESLLKGEVIKKALKEYHDFCKHNIGYEFKESYEGGMRLISKYVKGKKALKDEDAKKFADVLESMPDILKGRNNIEKFTSKEDSKRGLVRGGKSLTLNEQR